MRGLIGHEEFTTLPPGAVMVNVARGESSRLMRSSRRFETTSFTVHALDVTDPEPLPVDHPLWTFDDVLITPDNVAGLGVGDGLRNRVV